jgi:hypothetical protein
MLWINCMTQNICSGCHCQEHSPRTARRTLCGLGVSMHHEFYKDYKHER